MSKKHSAFKFKRFTIEQAGCAMKINTDGVLLAATAFKENAQRILDVGTGTGVIALMLAQRFESAKINAVEIDEQAAVTATGNAKKSVFSDRIEVFHSAFEDFDTDLRYDMIVSNPPFFVNDLRSEEERKGIARHADEGFFFKFIQKSNILLTEDGEIWLIVPVKQAENIVEIASDFNLNLMQRIKIHSDKSKPPFRMMICLSRGSKDLAERDFYIYESLKMHTREYKLLLKDFFLNY